MLETFRHIVLFVLLNAFLPWVANSAQELSPAQAIDEAGRLCTEAERITGEAHRKLNEGSDPGLLRKAELVAIEYFRQAIELWRKAGHHARLVSGTEELSRLYLSVHDVDNAVKCLRTELDFWKGLNDIKRQLDTINLIGIRQIQGRRTREALQTLKGAVEMSRGANLNAQERQALDALAMIYLLLGRTEDEKRCRERQQELESQEQTPVAETATFRPAAIPSQWYDIPSAPLTGEYRNVEGKRHAVLVNRSMQGIEMVNFGCVSENERKVKVINELIGMGRNHGGVGPGYYYEPFTALSGPLNRWTDKQMGCEGAARMAVVKATFADRTVWNAQGADWGRR